ncbi:MAG: metal-dependent hydrolase [Nodosilinea sp.]
MPLPLAHGLFSGSIVAMIHKKPTENFFRAIALGMFLGIAADFDFVLVYFLSMRGLHRGFSHSIGFSAIVFLLIFLILGKRKLRAAIAYGLAYGVHGILDFVTTKEGGKVELFWPVSTERVRLGWVGISEGAAKLPLAELIQAFAIELLIFSPFLLFALSFRRYFRRS